MQKTALEPMIYCGVLVVQTRVDGAIDSAAPDLAALIASCAHELSVNDQ